nr:MAG TPA: hypothetical protein [Caudoviricetes sp.]
MPLRALIPIPKEYNLYYIYIYICESFRGFWNRCLKSICQE